MIERERSINLSKQFRMSKSPSAMRVEALIDLYKVLHRPTTTSSGVTEGALSKDMLGRIPRVR